MGKAVGIQALPKNDKEKGFVLTVKKGKGNRPANSTDSVTMKGGARSSLPKIKSMRKQRYRKDLTKAALRRASAIIRSDKPLPARKGTKAAGRACGVSRPVISACVTQNEGSQIKP